MLVQCPNCQTTYKVPDTIVAGAVPTFRCSRCKHIFGAPGQFPEQPGKPNTGGQSAGQQEEGEQDLAFSFTLSETKSGIPEEETSAAPPPAPEAPASTSSEQSEGAWLMNPAPMQEEKPFIISEADATPENALRQASGSPPQLGNKEEKPPPAVPEAPRENILALDPYRDRQISTLPYLVLMGVLVVSYSIFAVMQQTQPQTIEKAIRRMPWVGYLLFKNDYLKQHIVLQSLRPSFQAIVGNREVFVVSGVALNQNPVSVRDVHVQGQVYGAEGKELEQQTAWIGNAISPKIIRGITAQDISDLQRLKPLRTFQIPAGGSVPFTIVFLRSTRGISEFSFQVLSAQDGS